MNKSKLIELIYLVIDDYNSRQRKSKRLDKSLDTMLYGDNGLLDSLGFVDFVVSVEDKINETYGINFTLADERAMSQQNNPFETVESLSNYIFVLLE
tara:strand:- start:959 stop:1249 length:291 start_codon:yes stop_codon:yes gene_type:complete